MSEQKHVIILGAGASATSGYPVAAKLTKIMADETHFEKYLKEIIDEREGFDKGDAKNIARPEFQQFYQAAQLLKRGSFATMDELSHLAHGGKQAEKVLQLKRLLRFVFGLDNPYVWHWGESDYPSFVNALFRRNETPREDVCILSFNYDPFLEYLLLSALTTRESFKAVNPPQAEYLRQAATSGMYNPIDLTWIDQPGFSHLKLHGTCVLPTTPQRERVYTWDNFFKDDNAERYRDLRVHSQEDPPVLLPWEIIHPSQGRLLTEDEFRTTVGQDWQHLALYPLFRDIWRRAQEAVLYATRISFVGISLAPFMEPEMRFLFAGKSNPWELVVANPANKHTKFGGYGGPADRQTPIGKIYHFVRDMLKPFKPPLAEQISLQSLDGFDDFIVRIMDR